MAFCDIFFIWNYVHVHLCGTVLLVDPQVEREHAA